MRRAGIGLLLTVGCLIVMPAAPAAAAGTVTVNVFGAVYTGDAGVNVVTFTDAPQGTGARARISETGISAGAGCVQDGANAAYCDIGATDDVSASLGAENDVATSNGTLIRYRLDGNAGDDVLTGSDSSEGLFSSVGDNLSGGEGRDTLIGRGGNDSLDTEEGDGELADGGDGEDGLSFWEGSGTGDLLRGGDGFDAVFGYYFGPDPPLGVTIDLQAQTGSVGGASVTLESVEDADGDEGADTLLGSSGTNNLGGDEGNDVIDGRGGPDLLTGDEGDDRIESRDGSPDLVRGEQGVDTCDRDGFDTIETCEAGALVALPPFGTPPPPDRTAPVCTPSGVPKRSPTRRLIRRGLAVRVVCDEDGLLTARLVGSLGRVGRGVRVARAGDLELASKRVAASAGTALSVRLKPGGRLRRLVRRGVRLRVELTAADAAGNERTATRRVRLR